MTLIEISKQDWTSADTIEAVNAGSLQRIAAAVANLKYQTERAERYYTEMQESKRSNAALRGHIRRLKNKITDSGYPLIQTK